MRVDIHGYTCEHCDTISVTGHISRGEELRVEGLSGQGSEIVALTTRGLSPSLTPYLER